MPDAAVVPVWYVMGGLLHDTAAWYYSCPYCLRPHYVEQPPQANTVWTFCCDARKKHMNRPIVLVHRRVGVTPLPTADPAHWKYSHRPPTNRTRKQPDADNPTD